MNNFHMREGKVEFRWKRWRNKKRQEVSSCLMVLFSGAVLLGAGGVALAGPTGGQVTGGQGTITNPNGTTTNINQQSNVLSINWQDFSIQQGETVNFYQPGSTSIAINRVIGGVPSYLAGALNANGRVFILNSAGITFTGTSQVNVGALLATTAMTVNGDPTQAASYSGSGYGAVINQGSISVSNGGFAILAAPYVQNTGFIKADLGTIALAGTNQFTLDLSGTGLINFVVPAGAVEKIVSDGKAVGVDNAGTLQARSGQVLISANVASEVVNAVVNLNGIVDADAFAANGQGGAVLVTAAGDINVGGQVTAKGSGAGNGGQIITKAVGADNIEQMAFVSATGGATGKGGLIEVSGKTVGLNGAIDPGKGGLLYVDPATFTIKNATSGQGTNFIGEHKLEALLQNGAGFLVNAAGNITIQDLSDNVLAGGGGDLTLHAGTGGAGNIIVQGVSDIIRTGSGDVTLTAAGNIGDSSHALSFVSGGANLSGVSQAGDIILTATNGGNIYVKSVTERAAGPGTRHALFSANAAGLFTAEGPIDLQVRANGVGTQSADAEVHIVANQIRLAGLTVLANATKFSSSGGPNAGGNAFANAIVNLNATRASDIGAMTVAATVAGSSGFRFHANAELIINEQTGFLMKGGPISVIARANAFSAGTSSVHDNAVLADAGLRINGSGPVHIDSMDVQATALGDKAGNDVALAHADLNGNDIRILGNATVTASGQAGPNVNGVALVLARATMNATGTAVDISSNVTVTAEANNPDHGRGASATADLRLVARSNTVTAGGDITVNALAFNDGSSYANAHAALAVRGDLGIDVDGNVSVLANALTLAEAGTDIHPPRASASASFTVNNGNIRIGGSLDVEANISSNNFDTVVVCAQAHLRASGSGEGGGSIEIGGPTKVLATAKTSAHTGFGFSGAVASASLSVHGDGHVSMGPITVKATADSLGEFKARAIAMANIVSSSSSVAINGAVDVEANAQDPAGSGAFANAKFRAFGHSGVKIGFEGNLESASILGDVTVKANAFNGGSGNATADATVKVTGEFGPVVIVGNVTLSADANDAGGGNALASASASIAGIGTGERAAVTIGSANVDGNIIGGDIEVTANAVDTGGGQAKAVSHVAMAGSESGSVVVRGGIALAANALSDGASADTTAASANALLQFSSVGHVIVDGPMTVAAHGTNNGSGKVFAKGAIDFGSAGSIELGDVTIDVKALNLGDGNGGAKALASFSHGSAGTSLTLKSLNLQAQASSFGGGNAIASAIGIIAQRDLVIPGAVTLNAQAVSHGGGNALASANLLLNASSGNLTVSGAIDVHANAQAGGLGQAQANAIATLIAFSSDGGGGNIAVGSVNVIANALHTGAGAGALALAELLIDPTVDPRSVTISGDVNVEASANNVNGFQGNMAASANALFSVGAIANLTIDGDVTLLAHATNTGKGKVFAQGSIDFSAVGNATLANLTIDVAALNIGTSTQAGTGGARANAIFAEVGGSNVHVAGLNLQAQASSLGTGNALANASAHLDEAKLAIAGNVVLNALAVADPGHASAVASLELITATGDLTVGGNIDIHANASEASGVANALANADLGAPGHVNIGGASSSAGHFFVRADANAADGPSTAHTAASANAHVRIKSAFVTVDNSMSIAAHATNNGPGKVKSHGSLQLGSGVSSINLARLTIDVKALNLSSRGTGGASAVADFLPTATTVKLGDLNLQAQASSHGGGDAKATASADLQQTALTIAGSVVVNALAVSDPGHASALANLNLAAGSGVLTVGGNVDVQANAVESAGNANAQALVNMQATGDGGSINIGGHFFDRAYANAMGTAEGDTAASANANVVLKSPHVTIASSMSIVAHATNDGVGKVVGKGLVNFSGGTDLELHQVTIDVKALNKNAQGSGGAVASANFSPTADTIHFTGLNLQAEASSNGGGNATANAIADMTQCTFSVDNDIVVNALAFTNGPTGNALAFAELRLDIPNGTGNIVIGGNVDVTAFAHGDPNNVIATAEALLHAEGFVQIKGNVDVTATASTDREGETGFANRVIANALLQVSGDGFETNGGVFFGSASSIEGEFFNFLNGNVTVSANEVSVGAQQGVALANANISGGILDEFAGIIGVAGNMTVTADASGGSNAANVVALAELNMFATIGDLINGDVDVEANASDPGNGIAHAGANATLVTDVNRIFVNGNIEVDATLSGNALRFGTASLDTIGHEINAGFASAFLNVRTLNEEVQGIELNGVSVTANTLLTNPAAAVSTGEVIIGAAGAIADVTIETSGGVHIDGAVSVNALANIAPTGAEGIAQATLTGTAELGSFGIEGNVAVTANLQIASPGKAFATASANVFAGDRAFMSRNLTVTATASTHASGEHATDLVLAKANLVVKGVHGAFFGTTSISANGHQNFFSGNIDVAAKTVASHGGIDVALSNVMLTASGESGGIGVAGNLTVTADATGGTDEADVVAIASLNAQAADFASFIGAVTVKANATDPGTGAAYAGAFGNIKASEDGVFVGKNITVAANLQGNELAFGSFSSERLGLFTPAGFADASLTIESDDGSIFTRGIAVTANALLTNPNGARHIGEGENSTSAGARANLNLFAGSSVFVSGPVSVNALANVAAHSMRDLASAVGSIRASSGDIVITGPLRVRANDQGLGSQFISVDAVANMTLTAGRDIVLPNAAVRAIADASGDFASGTATATLALNANRDVIITGGGAFAGASANMPNGTASQSHDRASADLLINAGRDVSIFGNVVAAAVAIGGNSGDVANAIVDIEAGVLGNGSVTMIGDLGAFAFADPANDHALASITVNARNDILVIGHDPIASAHAGNAAAFLQTHFTDSTQGFGDSDSTATARITIRAGGNITFINPNFDNILALLALPTQTPTIQPGDLTTIQMLIDGQDCGVLGSAGADPSKPACTKGPVNIPPGDDGLP